MIKTTDSMPSINVRILKIIEDETGGNVSKFAKSIGLKESARINRLFNKDSRNGVYPMPSTELLIMICSTYGYSSDYILFGEEKPVNSAVHHNTINISRNDVRGDSNNVANNGDSVSGRNDRELMELLRQSNENMNNLVMRFLNGRTQQ